jgi:hypothetical protein
MHRLAQVAGGSCGVTGFKETYRLLNNRRVLEGEPVDETILKSCLLLLTIRTIEDVAILLSVLATP